jgi:hypothetical protein
MSTLMFIPAALGVCFQLLAYKQRWSSRARLAGAAVPMAAAAVIASL